MSAAVKAKVPPMFYTSVDVDVDIDPEELEAAGWVYVGNNETAVGEPAQSGLVSLIREMHDDEHEGPMRWCRHSLCREVEYPR